MDLSNYFKIKNEIPSNVNILAVSKGFKSQEIKTIQNMGQNDFGESKFQEAFEKQLILKDFKQIKWHFIGRIQSNKIRKIVQNFKYIHSVDSFEKLQKISMISFEEKKNPSIMLQVKLSDDPTKGGFNPELLVTQWREIKQLKNITLKGLMTINPKELSSKENLNLFKKCRALSDSLQLPDCSMGMSGDWEEAIEAGSTWLRLGSIIFGDRG
ncbi:YggS family pyridoxal phosphate-dependent enzyme [Prochlorococcus marinus str. MU1404]|uniref:YggS family pyridoxal phosphate-dependent enzyme n=1 Tax=Prochlorococcus marinus TaxID=1219 RepID=UPI001ADC0917|nr:YggS family pyridoxal phosphate-dependent enzyme [Prochlorococcus marinus XMU1404]MBW3072670.1 YggS family pyridoxal phosphate-dependent enzyme [Prochlorococcus marinus str. MU1404]MCR8546072.1 YggS family pyridoxal phosphate-dependent enzyme [Prochlorococcus marinus CUG1432]